MTLLEADSNVRNWRKVVMLLHRAGFMGIWSANLSIDLANAILDHIHRGGSREGYAGPERQLCA